MERERERERERTSKRECGSERASEGGKDRERERERERERRSKRSSIGLVAEGGEALLASVCLTRAHLSGALVCSSSSILNVTCKVTWHVGIRLGDRYGWGHYFDCFWGYQSQNMLLFPFNPPT